MSSNDRNPDHTAPVGPARWNGQAQLMLEATWLRANRHKDQTIVDFSIEMPRHRIERLRSDARPLDVIEFALAAIEWEARVNHDPEDMGGAFLTILVEGALPLVRAMQDDQELQESQEGAGGNVFKA